MRLNILLLVAATAACSPATVRSALHYGAITTEVMAQGSLVCDAGSTHSAINRGYMESNPVMGSHPDGQVVAAYFTGTAAGVAIYNRALPDILRIAANLIVVGVEYDAVSYNTSVGVPLCGI